MDTKTSHLIDANIGKVFTPLKWAEWLINRWDIFNAWVDGAHICDPTAGQGAFPLAMLHIARRKGCLLYTSPSPRDRQKSRMPSSA